MACDPNLGRESEIDQSWGLVRLAIEDHRPGWVAVVVTRFLVVDLVWLLTLIMTNKRERVSILTSKCQSIEP